MAGFQAFKNVNFDGVIDNKVRLLASKPYILNHFLIFMASASRKNCGSINTLLSICCEMITRAFSIYFRREYTTFLKSETC